MTILAPLGCDLVNGFCHRDQLQTGRLLNISRNIGRARLEKIGELNKASVG